nr:hypothetical protein [Halobacillus kuroshimensis]
MDFPQGRTSSVSTAGEQQLRRFQAAKQITAVNQPHIRELVLELLYVCFPFFEKRKITPANILSLFVSFG